MNLLEKLDALKAKTGDTNASLAKRAGIPATTIYGLYQKGYGNMKLSTLQALCDYFDVPIDYLAKDNYEEIRNVLGSDSPAAKKLREIGHELSPGTSNPEVEELVNIYMELNSLGQQALMGTARGLSANPDMKKGGESSAETA